MDLLVTRNHSGQAGNPDYFPNLRVDKVKNNTSLLSLHGDLDNCSATCLIDVVLVELSRGVRQLFPDLFGVEKLSLTGVIALT